MLFLIRKKCLTGGTKTGDKKGVKQMPLSIKKRLERAVALKEIELKKTKCEHQQLKKALKNIIQAETAEKQNLAEKAKVRREWREAEQQEQEPAAVAEQQEQERQAWLK